MAFPAQNVRFLRVTEEDRGVRLDAFVGAALGVGRRTAARLPSEARVNGRRAVKGRHLLPGDEVSLAETPVSEQGDGAPPETISEDGDLLILAKPAGLPTVAMAGKSGPSVAQWLERHHPECTGLGRAGESGLVHRLDNGTSGLLLAARTASAYAALRSQFSEHTITKTYLAIVDGELVDPVTIDAAIGQHRKSRTRVRALSEGPHPRYAITPATSEVRPLRALGRATLVEARTNTGARHQIRAHLAHVGHPLVGDVRYGGTPTPAIPDYMLHASEVAWRDVVTGAPRTAQREAPAVWEDAMASLSGAHPAPPSDRD
ncbi:MAG: RluA family pseudouridine synthase [Candidatus Binatia bacterium]|nr:RluA family pseudouridine synthase [Candidatus Binatia bacterium]